METRQGLRSLGTIRTYLRDPVKSEAIGTAGKFPPKSSESTVQEMSLAVYLENYPDRKPNK